MESRFQQHLCVVCRSGDKSGGGVGGDCEDEGVLDFKKDFA